MQRDEERFVSFKPSYICISHLLAAILASMAHGQNKQRFLPLCMPTYEAIIPFAISLRKVGMSISFSLKPAPNNL